MKPIKLFAHAVATILTLTAPTQAQTKDAGDVTKPTLITLKMENAAPKDVFAELAKKANLEFPALPKDLLEKDPGPPISIDVTDQPFWLAMKDACKNTKISLKYSTDRAEPTIMLARDEQDWTNYPTVATGPFLVTLMHVQRNNFVNMNKPGDIKKDFHAKFTLFCEPRVRLLYGSVAAKIEEATDDKGNSLVPPEKANANMDFVSSWVHSLEGKLAYPKDPGTKIATLKASARFIVQTKSETIEYADPLASKNVTKIVAGRKILIKEIRRGPEEYEATVTFIRGDVPPDQWEQTVFPGNALRLIDAEGKILIAKGFGMGGKGDEATYVFKFEKEPPKGSRIGPPVKLAWEIPTAIKELPLAFEFKDLPLP